jgi:hypothetical protein
VRHASGDRERQGEGLGETAEWLWLAVIALVVFFAAVSVLQQL